MNKIEAKLKSRKKLIGKGKDCKDSYIVKVDLGRLNNLLEKEELMDKDLGKVVIRLEDYPPLKIFPIVGSYYPDVRRIDIYLFRDRGWYKIFQFFGKPMRLTKQRIIEVLAHEIDHAVRDLKFEKKFKYELFGVSILGIITALSDLIYPISPLEILARWFARTKMKDPEWLKCVQVKNKTKN